MPFANLKQVRLCYAVKGNPEDPALIMVMGFGGQLIQWPSVLLDELVDAGYCVIIFDNRDAGLTTFHTPQPKINLQVIFDQVAKGQKPSLPYTLKDMAEDIIQLMETLHIKRAHILGMSVGGMIAQLLAIYYPEKVESLMCISSSSGDPSLPPPTPAVQQRLMEFTQASSESEEDHVKRRLDLFKIYNPSFTAVDLENTAKLAHREFNRRLPGNSLVRQILAVTTAPSRVADLKKLRMKTLIIHGIEDPVFPLEHGEQLHELIQGSQFCKINPMGHGFTQKILKSVGKALTHALFHGTSPSIILLFLAIHA